jgi:hypothetical protein
MKPRPWIIISDGLFQENASAGTSVVIIVFPPIYCLHRFSYKYVIIHQTVVISAFIWIDECSRFRCITRFWLRKLQNNSFMSHYSHALLKRLQMSKYKAALFKYLKHLRGWQNSFFRRARKLWFCFLCLLLWDISFCVLLSALNSPQIFLHFDNNEFPRDF